MTGDVRQLFRDCRKAMGLPAGIRFRVSARKHSPGGHVFRDVAWSEKDPRPTVFLCKRALDFSPHVVEGILLHELGHLSAWNATEREVDALVERKTGIHIGYDSRGLETTSPRFYWRDRPAYLDEVAPH